MDSSRWPSSSSGHSDRKRTFGQMQSSTHSSQQQGSLFPQFLPQPHRSSFLSNNNNNHNHNNHASSDHFHFDVNNFNNMADRARNRAGGRSSPYPPPRLQHRTSQTVSVIDLTGESDEAPSPVRIRDARPSNRRPPRLGREILLDDDEDLIDLTGPGHQSEAEQDLVEVLQRQPHVRQPDPNLHRHHHRHQYDHRRPVNLAPPQRRPEASAEDLFLPFGANDPHRVSFFRRAMAHIPVHSGGIMSFIGRPPAGDIGFAAMNGMNYDAIAFGPGPDASPQKTPHVPPKPARPGFTRSPAALEKDQILICPACEEELIHHENENPAPTTNAKGKALTDKERAEHPFWVVRKCGHVFCNKCYQGRKNKTGDCESKFYLPDQPKSEKTLICVVDECQSAVSKPADWIGVFL